MQWNSSWTQENSEGFTDPLWVSNYPSSQVGPHYPDASMWQDYQGFGPDPAWQVTEANWGVWVHDTFKPLWMGLDEVSEFGKLTHVVKIDHLPAVQDTLQSVAGMLGMDHQLVKCAMMLIIAYPFSFVMRSVPNATVKHLMSAAGGFFLLQWLFEADWIHAFITSLVTYFICILAPKKYCASITMLFAMSYLTVCHIKNYVFNYEDSLTSVDFTGTQMVLTMKLTSFAYNVFDGSGGQLKEAKKTAADLKDASQSTEDAEKKKKAEDRLKKKLGLFEERKAFAIGEESELKFPNLLEFFGYMWCFPCLLGGPAFEYKDYVEGTKRREKGKEPPSSIIPAFKLFFLAFFCFGMHLAIQTYIPFGIYFDKKYLLESNLLGPGLAGVVHFLKCYGNLLSRRFKYYYVWKISEGACVLGGFGYVPETTDKATGKVITPSSWDGVENVDILGYELAPNISHLTKAWNKRTQKWLERYTYKRFNNNDFLTYFVSAFWHGIYPGYYLFFLTIAMYTLLFEKTFFVKFFPNQFEQFKADMKAGNQSLFKWVWFVITHIFLNYCGCVFMAKTLSKSLACWNYFNNWPFFAILILGAITQILPSSKKADNKKAAVVVNAEDKKTK